MIAAGYETKTEQIVISDGAEFLVRSLLDRRQFYDPTGAARDLGICSASWPLFGLVWPSGIQLAAQLARRPVSANERILEIGCGLGLASLVGQHRGARITASDCHPLTEKFLDKNARLNRLPLLKYRHGQWGAQTPPAPQGADVLTERYDMIIGSDVLYDRSAPEALAGFIDRHATPTAEVWIVDPNRGNRPAFNRHMAAYGFNLKREKHLQQQPAMGEGKLDTYKGRLLVYRRRQPDGAEV
jgi:predicted nicotinamide N-methyase